jgi:hypothetical protein
METVNAARRERTATAAALRTEASTAAHAAAIRAADAAPLLLPAPGDNSLGAAVVPYNGVLSAPFTARNSLYYAPDGRALSLAEAEAAVKGPPRAVDAAATRFASASSAAAGGAAQPGGSRAVTPGHRGGAYSRVVTPSPAPGIDDTPFMTWGRLDATPLRLDAEDVPIDLSGAGGRVAFHIPPAHKRGA